MGRVVGALGAESSRGSEWCVFIGIEGGGTKFVCVVGTPPNGIVDKLVVPTTTPDETLDQVLKWTHSTVTERAVRAVGLACFGPLDLECGSPTYGRLRASPKSEWSGVDVVGPLQSVAPVVALDTDVNGAALAEHRWGAGKGLSRLVYVTVGTGIGGGAVVDGVPLRGRLHPEMGHLSVRRQPDDDFHGVCPLHGDCLEGLASGTAIRVRTGIRGEDLRDGEAGRVVELVAGYIAQLVAAVTYILAPDRIVLGGGAMALPGLMAAVRRRAVEQLAGSGGSSFPADVADYVCRPVLGPHAGAIGALALAEDKWSRHDDRSG